MFPFDTGLSHNCPHLSHLSHSSHLFHIFARAAHTPITPIPLSLLIPPTIARVAHTPRWRKLAACTQFKIQNSKFIISTARAQFKIHNFLCRLHYTYHIQTIQEERTKSEKSAKYKHLIKVPKVVCFTFQLF